MRAAPGASYAGHGRQVPHRKTSQRRVLRWSVRCLAVPLEDWGALSSAAAACCAGDITAMDLSMDPGNFRSML